MENLTVIVPVYNEEKLISSSLNRLIALKKNFKILVVDDCSDDGSVEIIKSIVKKNKNIQLIEKKTNQGKGSTIVEGFKNVDTEFCTIHDADLEYFPDDLIDMHKKINKNISVINMRGNIDTRIKKIEQDKLDGIILAADGVKSLNLENKIGFSFKIQEVLPAAGKGIRAV